MTTDYSWVVVPSLWCLMVPRCSPSGFDSFSWPLISILTERGSQKPTVGRWWLVLRFGYYAGTLRTLSWHSQTPIIRFPTIVPFFFSAFFACWTVAYLLRGDSNVITKDCASNQKREGDSHETVCEPSCFVMFGGEWCLHMSEIYEALERCWQLESRILWSISRPCFTLHINNSFC